MAAIRIIIFIAVKSISRWGTVGVMQNQLRKKEANLEEFEALLKERERLKRELESSNKRNYAFQGQLEGIKRKEGSFQI